MKLKLICFFVFATGPLMSFSSTAQAAGLFDLFFELDSEYSHSLKERTGPNYYEHKSNKRFIDGTGLGVGFRAGLGTALDFGIVGSYAWRGHTPVQKNPYTGSENSYRYESNYGLLGAYLGVSAGGGPVKLMFEYFPLNHNRITYADTDGENPFAHDDNFYGKAWGGGISFNYKNLRWTIMFRHRNYDKGRFKGGPSQEFPSDTYSEYHVQEFVVQFGGTNTGGSGK